MKALTTIKEIRKAHTGRWFDAGAMKSFKTTILADVYRGLDCAFFVTHDLGTGYTVRIAHDASGDIDTAGELCQFNTSKDAKDMILALAASNDLGDYVECKCLHMAGKDRGSYDVNKSPAHGWIDVACDVFDCAAYLAVPGMGMYAYHATAKELASDGLPDGIVCLENDVAVAALYRVRR